MRYESSIYEMGKAGVRASIDRVRRWNTQVALWNLGMPGAIQAAQILGASKKAAADAAAAASKNVVTTPNPLPAPTLTSLTPNGAAVGSPDTIITLTGTGFKSGAKATAGTTDLVTTFTNNTSLSATIPATSLASAATLQISVTNPDGQKSAAIAFAVA